MLIRLVYVSTAVDSVDLNEFKRILSASQQNNERRDLTGMLAFNSKIFLQGVEGSREAINELYAKLIKDARHFNVMMLKYEGIAERHWSNWSMGFAAPNANSRALFLRYSSQSVFNPYSMTGDNAEKMLMDLSSTTVALESKAVVAPVPASASASVQTPVEKRAPVGLLARFMR